MASILQVQLTRPNSLDILPICKVPVFDVNGTKRQLKVAFFFPWTGDSMKEIFSDLEPPFTADLANAETISGGEYEVDFSFDLKCRFTFLPIYPSKNWSCTNQSRVVRVERIFSR